MFILKMENNILNAHVTRRKKEHVGRSWVKVKFEIVNKIEN